ncbi:MAG: hypothetical protein UU47_C0003G0021 [candidate division TM6 bacterium GW2011_GWE2_41_16]|nr:MAG: hypothetical protein UU47_C0003G0021 [candidate division TM6 bacterium GW2011_GWE2_41_16]
MNDRVNFNRWLWSKLYLVGLINIAIFIAALFLYNGFNRSQLISNMGLPIVLTTMLIVLTTVSIIVELLKKTSLTTEQKADYWSLLSNNILFKYVGLLIFFLLFSGITFTAVVIELATDSLLQSLPYWLTPWLTPVAIGLFFAIVFEESYNLVTLYKQTLNTKKMLKIIAWAAVCAISFMAITKTTSHSEYSVDIIDIITSIILVSMIQPLGSRKFILKL